MDQTAYIQGRQITETIRVVQDVIDQANVQESKGVIIFLNQQKAFDCVGWCYVNLFWSHFCVKISVWYISFAKLP